MRKPMKTIVLDVLDYALYSLLIGACICGFWFVFLLVGYLCSTTVLHNRWFMIAAFLAAVLAAFGILRYLAGGHQRREKKEDKFKRKGKYYAEN